MKMAGILLSVFIFASVMTMVNSLDIFSYQMDDYGYNVNNTIVNESTKDIIYLDQTNMDDPNQYNPDVGAWSIITNIMSMIKNALVITIYVYPTLITYGVPSAIAGMIQGILSLVEMLFLITVLRRFRVS